MYACGKPARPHIGVNECGYFLLLRKQSKPNDLKLGSKASAAERAGCATDMSLTRAIHAHCALRTRTPRACAVHRTRARVRAARRAHRTRACHTVRPRPYVRKEHRRFEKKTQQILKKTHASDFENNTAKFGTHFFRTVREYGSRIRYVQRARTVRARGVFARARASHIRTRRAPARAVPYGHRTRGPYVQKNTADFEENATDFEKTQQILNKTPQILAHTFCAQSGRTVRVRDVQCARAVRTYSARALRAYRSCARARVHTVRVRARPVPYGHHTCGPHVSKIIADFENRNRFSTKGSRF